MQFGAAGKHERLNWTTTIVMILLHIEQLQRSLCSVGRLLP